MRAVSIVEQNPVVVKYLEAGQGVPGDKKCSCVASSLVCVICIFLQRCSVAVASIQPLDRRWWNSVAASEQLW